jgi:hypothetical protein
MAAVRALLAPRGRSATPGSPPRSRRGAFRPRSPCPASAARAAAWSLLITGCVRLRPDETGLTDPLYASKAAPPAIAHRIQLLEAELTWPTSGWPS